MNNLAGLYHLGRGVRQDDRKAAELAEQAAKAGDGYAMVNLGLLAETRTGDPDAALRAAELYQRAAANDEAMGLEALGFLYLSGRGVPQSNQKAAESIGAAAVKGLPSAQNAYGMFLLGGIGVKRDVDTAIHWFSAAAMRAHDRARRPADAKLSRKTLSRLPPLICPGRDGGLRERGRGRGLRRHDDAFHPPRCGGIG